MLTAATFITLDDVQMNKTDTHTHTHTHTHTRMHARMHACIKDMVLLCLRSINDIFIIWKRTKKQLITFINELNKKHKNIKFESEISS